MKAHRNTNANRGFTLVELMITCALVAILATLAIPLWHGMRERGFIAVMQADLRNLAVTQESFFFDNEFYASQVNDLVNKGFRGTAAVQYSIAEATRTGWSATVSHPGTSRRCYLFVGFAAPVGLATRDGVIECG